MGAETRSIEERLDGIEKELKEQRPMLAQCVGYMQKTALAMAALHRVFEAGESVAAEQDEREPAARQDVDTRP